MNSPVVFSVVWSPLRLRKLNSTVERLKMREPSDPTMDEDEARSERQFLRPINPDPITKRLQQEKPVKKKETP